MQIRNAEHALEIARRHIPETWTVECSKHVGDYVLKEVTWSGCIVPMRDYPSGTIFLSEARDDRDSYILGNSYSWERFSPDGTWLESGGMGVYWSLVLPFAGTPKPSPWHPDKPTGAFSRLMTGAFKTEAAAHEWAREKLNGGPYELRFVHENEYSDSEIAQAYARAERAP